MPGMWAVWVLMDKSAVVSLTPLLKMLGGHRCLLCLLLIPYWSTVSVFFFFHLHQETLKKSLSCPFQEGQTNSWSHAVSSNTFTQLSCYINPACSSWSLICTNALAFVAQMPPYLLNPQCHNWSSSWYFLTFSSFSYWFSSCLSCYYLFDFHVLHVCFFFFMCRFWCVYMFRYMHPSSCYV